MRVKEFYAKLNNDFYTKAYFINYELHFIQHKNFNEIKRYRLFTKCEFFHKFKNQLKIYLILEFLSHGFQIFRTYFL